MRRTKGVVCLLLSLLMLWTLAPVRVSAAKTLYFTAMDDILLDLNDETMPFWAGERLYIAYTAISNGNIGVSCSRSREKNTVILYRQRDALTFDLGAGRITDGNGIVYEGSAIVRGDMVFLPVDLISSYFGLMQSLVRTNYGYLVRLKSSANVLPDMTFVDAASSRMEQSYNQYMRAHEEGNTPNNGSGTRPEPAAQRTVYLLVEVTRSEQTRQTLTLLSARRDCVTFLLTPEAIRAAGDAVRGAYAAGHALALRADGSAGAAALAQIEAGNRELWRAVSVKTRLVYLPGASEETAQQVRTAGYCVIRCALDYGAELPAAARMASQILNAADRGGGSCCVCLGSEEGAFSPLSALLSRLRGENCTFARHTEITA